MLSYLRLDRPGQGGVGHLLGPPPVHGAAVRRQVGPGLLQGGAQVRVVGGQRKTLVALAGAGEETKEIEDDFLLRFDYVGMGTLLLR